MKQITQTLPVVLAALLQLMPMLRNIASSPAVNSSFAIVLRWGIGSTVALGAVDAVSGATNYFTSPSDFAGTVGVPFTNNLTILISGGDAGAVTTLTTNTTSVSLTANGQTTTFAMPPGLTLKFVDKNPIYNAIYGTPSTIGTNSFKITMSYPGQTSITTNITIRITAGSTGSSPPVITNQPVGVISAAGSNATFSVTAGGTAPLKYQWFFNTNSSLLNATNSSLTITNLQPVNAGIYSVTITNSAGSTNSVFALLTVLVPPVITSQPAGATIVAGGTTNFMVAAGGTAPLNFQWFFNTSNNLAGETNTSLNLVNTRAAQAGIYSVVITNGVGAVTSSPALLAVTAPASSSISSPGVVGGQFQFTFIPVVGLTNSILSSSNLNGGSWAVLTNVAPPATTNPITVFDPLDTTNHFYRVQVVP